MEVLAALMVIVVGVVALALFAKDITSSARSVIRHEQPAPPSANRVNGA
jgi:hypothetical protein